MGEYIDAIADGDLLPPILNQYELLAIQLVIMLMEASAGIKYLTHHREVSGLVAFGPQIVQEEADVCLEHFRDDFHVLIETMTVRDGTIVESYLVIV